MAGFLNVWQAVGLVLCGWILDRFFGIRVGFVEGVALLLVIFALWRIERIDTALRGHGDDLDRKLSDIEGRIDRLESD